METGAYVDTYTVNNLGNLYRDQGKLKKAKEMYQPALKRKEKAWRPEHMSTLDHRKLSSETFPSKATTLLDSTNKLFALWQAR